MKRHPSAVVGETQNSTLCATFRVDALATPRHSDVIN